MNGFSGLYNVMVQGILSYTLSTYKFVNGYIQKYINMCTHALWIYGLFTSPFPLVQFRWTLSKYHIPSYIHAHTHMIYTHTYTNAYRCMLYMWYMYLCLIILKFLMVERILKSSNCLWTLHLLHYSLCVYVYIVTFLFHVCSYWVSD